MNYALPILLLYKNMSQSYEESMRCPFDPSHVMPYNRFLNHIDKCKFPQKHLYHKCRFNPYHVIHQDLISQHQDKCPDRKKYQPIEDDKQEWWGVEQPQKPQKSTVSSTSTYQTSKGEAKSVKVEVVNKQKKYKKIQKAEVEIQDFGQADFSSRQD